MRFICKFDFHKQADFHNTSLHYEYTPKHKR